MIPDPRDPLPMERLNELTLPALLLYMAARNEHNSNRLFEEIQRMATSVVTRDQFDAALQTLLAVEAQRDATIQQALSDLQAKVSAGQVAPEDFSAELTTIMQLQQKAAALTQIATVDDPASANNPAGAAANSTITNAPSTPALVPATETDPNAPNTPVPAAS